MFIFDSSNPPKERRFKACFLELVNESLLLFLYRSKGNHRNKVSRIKALEERNLGNAKADIPLT